MNEGSGEQSKGEELQFDKAEFTVPDAMRACSRCQARLEQEYFEAGGNFVCPACAREVGSDEGWGNFGRAVAFGVGATLLGTIIWFTIIKLTDREFGLIAIAIGLLVGFAVRQGARGHGGRRYQALAMVLTYVSITASYVPLVIKGFQEADEADAKESAALTTGQAPSPASDPGVTPASASELAPEQGAPDSTSLGGFVLALVVVFALAFASPFLGGLSNVMGLLIIGIALYEAWKLNKRIVVSGPFQIPHRSGRRDIVTSAEALSTSARSCRSCETELPASALACPSCGSLVHSAELGTLAAAAEKAERASDNSGALRAWREALSLLPAGTAQHAKVLSKVQALSALVPRSESLTQARPAAEQPQPGSKASIKWLASLGAVGLLLLKFKAIPLFLLGKGKLLLLGLTQAKTFFTMILAAGVYTMAFGWWFALGLVLSIYVHEMGHVAWLARYGIAASAPMFIPGVGAFVRLKQHPATVAEDARVGLAGPVWGAAAAVVALVAGSLLHQPILTAIGRVGAWINLFNLLPVWQLDGGRAFAALTRRQRAVVAVGLWLLALTGFDGLLFLLAIAATARAAMQGSAPATGDRPVLVTYLVLAASLTAMAASGGGDVLGGEP